MIHIYIYIHIHAPNIYITCIRLYTYTPYIYMHIYLYMVSDLPEHIASNILFSRRKAPSAPPERPKSAGSRWGTRVERGFYEEGRCLRKIHATMTLQNSIVNWCQFFTTRCPVSICGVLVYSCAVSFCVLSCIFSKSKPHVMRLPTCSVHDEWIPSVQWLWLCHILPRSPNCPSTWKTLKVLPLKQYCILIYFDN